MKTIREQVDAIKEQYPDVVILFQYPDHYKCFYEDAEKVSKILGVTFEERADGVVQTRLPLHDETNILGEIVRRGWRVAICDKPEEPEKQYDTQYKKMFNDSLQQLQEKKTEQQRKEEKEAREERAALELLRDKLQFLKDYGYDTIELLPTIDDRERRYKLVLTCSATQGHFVFFYDTLFHTYLDSTITICHIDKIIDRLAKYYFENIKPKTNNL